MSFDGALARARTLKTSLLDHGVKRVSIELSPGRPGTPNGQWWDDRFIGKLSHHIVSSRSMGPTPGLWLVKNGRTDVPGPLANGYGGFDETYRIICMGWANHPGAGGPWTIPGGTIPRDNGRPYLFGTEYEGGISLSDWTDSFREFMGRSNAAVCDWLGVDERSHGEHLTWAPGRKIDRLKYTTSSGRAELRPFLGGDDDMPLSNDDIQKIAEAVAQRPNPTSGVALGTHVRKADEATTAIEKLLTNPLDGDSMAPRQAWKWGDINTQRNNARLAALQAAVGELLEHDPSNPLTREDLDAAVEAGMQKVQLEVRVVDGEEP